MAAESTFYRNILENMTDGVMTLDLEGKIIMFNPAAARILGLGREEVLNRPFGEIFLMEMEGIDVFNQTILDAIYESKVGYTKMVDFRRKDGVSVNLALTSSYLRVSEDSKASNAGVIVVFSDITEMQKLQEAEKELNQKLRQAYLEIEDSNRSLKALLKKVQVVRVAATLLVIALFAGVGLYSWNKDFLSLMRLPRRNRPVDSPAASLRTFVVQPQLVSSNISLGGFVEPLEEINVLAPFDGKVHTKIFEYGQQVRKGDLLLRLDISQLEVKLREAQAKYIKARQQYKNLKNWDKNNEVSRAKRAHIKAKNSLAMSVRKLKESTLLLEKGIVPAGEHESVKSAYENQKLDFAAAEEELAGVLKKGSPENVNIASFEFQNARVGLNEIKAQLKGASVYAPVDGIIIQPLDKEGKKKKAMAAGVSVTPGEILLAVGNLEGISIKSQVDEIDIGRIKLNQEVIVSSDAFADLTLTGKIKHIASNASQSTRSQVPMFDITVRIATLTAEQKKRIRLGMSTHLQVRVYHNPDALLVPIETVRSQGGKNWLAVKDKKTGQPAQVEVQTGMTTLQMVEITRGLQPGDEVVIAAGAPAAGGFSPAGKKQADDGFEKF